MSTERSTKPIIKSLAKGQYILCTCGRSSNKPFCDKTHETTGLKPIVVELPEDKTFVFCGCGYSKNKPYCDGSHRDL